MVKFLGPILLLLLSFSAYSQNFSPLGDFRIKNFGLMEYDGNAKNWDVLQDDEGIMIFANNGKILIYDGNNWQGIKMVNRDHPRTLGKDQSGIIFVGGVGEFGKLDYDKNGKRIYTKISDALDSLNFGDIWSIHFFNQRTYFFARDYIFEFDNESNEINSFSAPEGGFIQRTVFLDESVIMNVKFGVRSK